MEVDTFGGRKGFLEYGNELGARQGGCGVPIERRIDAGAGKRRLKAFTPNTINFRGVWFHTRNTILVFALTILPVQFKLTAMRKSAANLRIGVV
jgi:hypothetical protein